MPVIREGGGTPVEVQNPRSQTWVTPDQATINIVDTTATQTLENKTIDGLALEGDLTLEKEQSHTISVGTSTTADTAGGDLFIISGAPDAAGGEAAGSLNLLGAVGGATSGGGAVIITSGAGGSTSGQSGLITIATGVTTASSESASGAITIQTGLGSNTAAAGTGGASGAVTLQSRAGGTTATGTGGNGGLVTIAGGAGGAASGAGTGGIGGSIAITPGAGGGTVGGTAGAPGICSITGLRTASGTAVAITGATVLTQRDSGGIFTIDQDAAFDIDLPSPTAGPGLRFTFVITDAGAQNVTITVLGGVATFVGTIINAVTSVLPATGATLTFATGVAAVGDTIEIISISTTLYLVRAVCSANGGITIA